MIQFDHPNVMSLIGVVVVPSTGGSGSGNGPCMVMPFMARGSLLDQLRAHSEEITETDASNKQVSGGRKIYIMVLSLMGKTNNWHRMLLWFNWSLVIDLLSVRMSFKKAYHDTKGSVLCFFRRIL